MSRNNKKYEELYKKNSELQKENEKVRNEIRKLQDEEVTKLNRALESSAEAIFMTNLDGIITFINREFTNLYGFTPDEVIGKTTPRILKSGVMSPESYKYFWDSIKDKKVVKSELINKTKDGRLITVEGSANPILNEKDEIIGFIGVQHDISLRKRSEEALKRSEELFRKAFMTSPDAVNINRLSDGLYVLVNRGFTEILGYTEEETIGKTSIDLNIWDDPKIRTILVKKIEKEGVVSNFEALFRKKDGGIVNGLMSASLFDFDGVPHILSETKDISRQKQIDQAFNQQRFLINALMKYLPDHVYFKDLESRFIRINDSHAKSLGLTDPEQAVGKTDLDFHSPEHARMAKDDEETIMKTGKTLIREEKIISDNAVAKWILATKLPLRDLLGKVIGTFGVSRDITNMKKAEEAMKLSEERLRSVTESANAAIISTDINETIVAWNRGAEMVFGYKGHEVVGKTLELIIHKDFRERQAQVVNLLKMGGGKYMTGKTVELNGVRKGGEVFPVELSFSEWKTSEGQFFTGILRDITIRKRAELENQVLFEITNGITATSNLDELLKLIHISLGKVVYAENIFIALHDPNTGFFSFPYFVDKFDQVPSPMSMEKSCTSYVFRTRKPFLFSQEKYDQLVADGEVEIVGSDSPSWIGIPLQTPSRAIGVLVLQNYERKNVYAESDVNLLMSIGSQIAISIERKRIEEEILLKNELLQSLNSEKDKFFSILAHDLRGPLSAFVDATQIITEDIQNMTLEEIKEITESMKASATNIYSLLENLLEWSRLMRDGLEFVPNKINLKETIGACLDVLSESARKKEIEIVITIPDELFVATDGHMFNTIIRNLVSNAIKFTTPGGIVNVTADVNNDQSVEIVISDSGIGMTAELKNKLFILNEKTRRKGTEGEPSTGLGLLLCKEFIEKHGGRIWVESEVGKGSSFSFTLPGS